MSPTAWRNAVIAAVVIYVAIMATVIAVRAYG